MPTYPSPSTSERRGRWRQAATAWITALHVAVAGTAASAAEDPIRYDHRVVVATTALDRAEDVNASLEHNVNRLGALGYELTALVGGDATILDALLSREPYLWNRVDHAGLTFAVMARPAGRPAPARHYRLLHVRTTLELEPVVVALGAGGYRMTVTALEGEIVHLAFERTASTVAVDYHVFRNRGRRSWMELVLADPDARWRVTRVMPVALDAAVVELGPPQPTPVEMQWLSTPAHLFSSLEAPLRELVKGGARVDLVRTRANDVSLLVVRPAGAAGSAADYDLDDGPWGAVCARGRLAGAVVLPNGHVACATDQGGSPVSNLGLDLTVRPQPTANGRTLFRGPDCDVRARLTSTRTAAPRVAVALQFEREIVAAVAPGFRVMRALAAQDSNGQRRIVTLTSDGPLPPVTAAPSSPGHVPPLVAEAEGRPDDRRRDREDRLNAALADDPRFRGAALWFELNDTLTPRSARLLGCVATIRDREPTAAAARELLAAQGLARITFVNDLVIR